MFCKAGPTSQQWLLKNVYVGSVWSVVFQFTVMRTGSGAFLLTDPSFCLWIFPGSYRPRFCPCRLKDRFLVQLCIFSFCPAVVTNTFFAVSCDWLSFLSSYGRTLHTASLSLYVFVRLFVGQRFTWASCSNHQTPPAATVTVMGGSGFVLVIEREKKCDLNFVFLLKENP